MKELTDLISQPIVWKVIFAYWVFSAAVGALPTPEANTSKWYVFMFRFGHLLGGNLSRAAVALKVPGAEAETKQP